MMKIKPIGDRVLVKREEAKTESKGGILLPDQAQRTSARGVVLEVGPGRVTDRGVLIPMTVKAGEKVYLAQYGGTKIKVEEDDRAEYVIVSESDILAVVE